MTVEEDCEIEPRRAKTKPQALIVSPDQETSSALREALPAMNIITAATIAEALVHIEKNSLDLLVADWEQFADETIPLLQACAKRSPNTRRVLTASYADFPSVVRTGAGRWTNAVLAKPLWPSLVRTVLDEILNRESEAPKRAAPTTTVKAPTATGVLNWSESMELLNDTIRVIANQRHVVVRHLPRYAHALHIEFVALHETAAKRVQDALHDAWGGAFKRSGEPLPRSRRRHPVSTMLRPLAKNQELLVRTVRDPAGREAYVYAAFLPWQRRQCVTMVVGIWSLADDEELARAVKDLHHLATLEAAELPLPELNEGSEGAVISWPEYDWVVTAHYVGPDRRAEPTTFFNRFVLMGKRRRNASSEAHPLDAFVDRLLPSVAWLALAYILLSFVDAVFTVRFVHWGEFQEINPIWRAAVLSHPWFFLLAKNLLSWMAIFIVVRFQLLRTGRWVLLANLLVYVCVDVYWAVLLKLELWT
ncbi:MAG: hypothetical protein A2289_16465 [Deltaproteobacteria bacterium RIFOXYA12_FULL_58_15]|nr:MAG: hypothetical protein A2289_16465 [Deltaproteobacteria bacterium RIFOXYA12_FULL_58_15]OGR10616.1 MAG: hypothetical protein A2341_17515 [Deltaproteobacteria bacterium RIFOXYB12_FULL_58_9]